MLGFLKLTLQQKGSIARTPIARTFCPHYRPINSEDKSLSSLNSSRRGKYWLVPYSEDFCPRYSGFIVAIWFAGK